MKRSKGFTLIELLISVMILSMVVFVGSLSFSTFSSRWNKDDQRFTGQLQQFQKLVMLNRLMDKISNYMIKTDTGSAYYFEGRNHSMSFVSEGAIFTPNTTVHATLNVEVLDDGRNRLVYYETQLDSRTVFDFEGLPPPDRKLVLLEADNIRFNYFGWRSSKERLQGTDLERRYRPQWANDYNAAKSGVQPEVVSIIWDNNEPILFRLKSDNAVKFGYLKEIREDA